jgi:putative membrane protein
MKKLNLDTIIKILILLGFSLFYFRIIINNEILMYVHPRIVPFVVFGMIAMFVIALFLIKDSFHNKKKKFKFKNYGIFIIPLIMIFFMQSTNANSAIKTSDINTSSNITSNNNLGNSSNNTSNQGNNINNNLTSANSTFEIYGGKTESDGQGAVDKKELDIKNNVIEVNTKNFVFSLDEILGNPGKYEGKEIEITGFVYKDKDLKENEYIIGRFMMICCAADMQIAGIRCDSNNLESYDSDTWIKIKGKIKKDTFEGEVDPLIVVEHVEKDLNPDTSYVYPF